MNDWSRMAVPRATTWSSRKLPGRGAEETGRLLLVLDRPFDACARRRPPSARSSPIRVQDMRPVCLPGSKSARPRSRGRDAITFVAGRRPALPKPLPPVPAAQPVLRRLPLPAPAVRPEPPQRRPGAPTGQPALEPPPLLLPARGRHKKRHFPGAGCAASANSAPSPATAAWPGPVPPPPSFPAAQPRSNRAICLLSKPKRTFFSFPRFLCGAPPIRRSAFGLPGGRAHPCAGGPQKMRRGIFFQSSRVGDGVGGLRGSRGR